MAESQARIGIYADDRASPTIKSVQGGLTGIAQQAKSSILTGVGLGAGVTAFNLLGNAAHKVVDVIGDSITAASNLAESQNKVAVVFGDSTDTINQWAEESATAFGMSEQAALEAVGTYGNLFQAFGIGADESAKMSQSLVELAADLASFNNTSVDDALIALRAGLSGETEPLKRFGIALTDARMRAELASQGVRGLGSTLTAGQKAQAAYALIMKDSSLAQGDFARTSEGLANQQRILAAQIDDLTAKAGQGLLPVVTELTSALTDLLYITDRLATSESGVEGINTAFGGIPSTISIATDAIHRLADEMRHEEEVAEASGRTTANNWIAMGEAIQDSTTETTDHLTGHWIKTKDKVVQVTADMARDLADELTKGQTDWEDAVDAYGDYLENNLLPVEETAAIEEQLVFFMDQLVQAQAAGDADWIAEVEATIAILNQRHAALAADLPEHARRQGVSYTTALAAWTGQVGMVGSGWANELARKVTIDLYAAGQYASGTWMRGFTSTAYSSAYGWLAGLKQMLVGSSPPPKGPLKDIDTGAMKVGQAWAEGLTAGMDTFAFPSLGGLTNAAASTAGGSGSSMIPATVAGAGGPVTIQVMLNDQVLAEAVDRQLYYMTPGAARLPR